MFLRGPCPGGCLALPWGQPEGHSAGLHCLRSDWLHLRPSQPGPGQLRDQAQDQEGASAQRNQGRAGGGGAARALAGPAELQSAISRGSGLCTVVIFLWSGRLIKNQELHLGAGARQAGGGEGRVGQLADWEGERGSGRTPGGGAWEKRA